MIWSTFRTGEIFLITIFIWMADVHENTTRTLVMQQLFLRLIPHYTTD